MINKKYEFQNNKNISRKIIFYILLIIYFSGLCSGSLFSVKNAENLNYVTNITGIENFVKNEKNGLFAAYMRIYIRDILFIAITLLFKYAGVLQGLCICIPFVAAFQNACIYVAEFAAGKSIYNIIVKYVLKDTAISFLLIIFCYTISKDILNKKFNIKKDIKKTVVYFTGITTVYIIDIAIKILFV